MTQEALKLALEALENSVDLVVEDAYNAEKLYGNYPTRQGKVGGLKVLAEQHKQAITAIKEALAQTQEPDDGYCKACDGWKCTAKAGCVALDNSPQEQQSCDKRTWVGSGDLEDSNAYLTPPQEQQSCDKRTWVGLDHADKKKFSSWLDHKTDDEVFTAIDNHLREMNT